MLFQTFLRIRYTLYLLLISLLAISSGRYLDFPIDCCCIRVMRDTLLSLAGWLGFALSLCAGFLVCQIGLSEIQSNLRYRHTLTTSNLSVSILLGIVITVFVAKCSHVQSLLFSLIGIIEWITQLSGISMILLDFLKEAFLLSSMCWVTCLLHHYSKVVPQQSSRSVFIIYGFDLQKRHYILISSLLPLLLSLIYSLIPSTHSSSRQWSFLSNSNYAQDRIGLPRTLPNKSCFGHFIHHSISILVSPFPITSICPIINISYISN